ncbi:hypothetical protein [Alkalicoccus luteus]|uniref:Uncharacterized protein n=1 Tax=Alkalicoccus luteus TaxID=1237094 RepID=A0A969Q0N9_9BACI|nr:hypothetical protein [Alkalicoccus luteus]NJP38972.1 hypothetical protein [Alkalicoccus luteus]
MGELHKTVEKFYRALDALHIEYDAETGRLSEPIIMIAYNANRRFVIDRVFLFKRFFLIFDKDQTDVTKVFYDKVQSFRSTVKKF